MRVWDAIRCLAGRETADEAHLRGRIERLREVMGDVAAMAESAADTADVARRTAREASRNEG